MKHVIIGTAGHVDHGKTLLIERAQAGAVLLHSRLTHSRSSSKLRANTEPLLQALLRLGHGLI